MTRDLVVADDVAGRMPARTVPSVSPPDGGPSPAELTVVAFRLGWHVAELYASEIARQQPPAPTRPPHALPGLSAFSRHERDLLLAAEIAADMHALEGTLTAVGIAPVDIGPFAHALDDLSRRQAEVKLLLYELHKELLPCLWAADFRLGKAYSLGRALADTSLVPSVGDPLGFGKYFDQHRIGQLAEWLDDLGSAFPERAAPAVAQSLTAWRDWTAAWVAQRQDEAPARDGDVDRRLREQGHLWRELLSGDKPAEDLLGPDDYIRAAEHMIAHTRSLARDVLRRWWFVVAGTLVAVGGAVVLVAEFAPSASKTGGIVVTALAGLGFSWKTIGTTLGKFLRRVEQPLWDDELAQATAQAVDRTPQSGP
jgi:hypothetical protein